MKIKLIVIVLLLSTNFLNAQTDFRPGYIITNQFDTISGIIDYRGDVRNCRICVFKPNKNSETIEYLPGDIHSYRFENSKYYISKEIMLNTILTKVYVEYIVDGIVDLYYYANNYNLFYLIEQEDGRLAKLDVEVKSDIKVEDKEGNYIFKFKRYIGVLKAAFRNCPEIMHDIDKTALSHKSLAAITKKYHDYICDGEECIIYEKVVPLIITISPIIGIGTSNLYFINNSFYSNFDFSQFNYPSIGISINTSVRGFNEKISLQFETTFNQNKYFSSYNIQKELKREYYDLSIHSKSIQPSLSIKYTFPKGKLRPTLAIGIISNIFLSVDSKLKTEEVINSVVYTSETHNVAPVVNSQLGVFSQIGFNYWLKNKHALFCNLKYSLLSGKNNTASTDIASFNLSIGYYITGNSNEK